MVQQRVTESGPSVCVAGSKTAERVHATRSNGTLSVTHRLACHLNKRLFLPARRYASAGYRDRNVSVCPSVRHAPVLCQNEES